MVFRMIWDWLFGTDGDESAPEDEQQAVLGRLSRVRLRALLGDAEPRSHRHEDMFEGSHDVLCHMGWDIKKSDPQCFDIDDVTERAPDDLLGAFLRAAWFHIQRVEKNCPGVMPIRSSEFEEQVNQIVGAAGYDKVLSNGDWIPSIRTEEDALLQTLLEGGEDMAPCRQGDLQVNMVVSTLQERLVRPGAVFLDYGAGRGRVLAGLTTAKRFPGTRYIAVEEPINDEIRKQAEANGAELLTREQLPEAEFQADVIMVLNTLHHMPFSDIPRQISLLLKLLRSNGVLLVHEMGRLPEPEQRNVPWRAEDLDTLFESSLLNTNPRNTVSGRKQVPLTNMLVSVTAQGDFESDLKQNVQKAWDQMKRRVLNDIDSLYRASDESRFVELRHALITNANLDLNRP